MTPSAPRRRHALGPMVGAPLALAAASAAVPPSASAAEATGDAKAPRVRGPEIYMGLHQRELDGACDQRVWAPNSDTVTRRMSHTCDEARRRLGEPLRRACGDKPVEATPPIFSSTKDQSPSRRRTKSAQHARRVVPRPGQIAERARLSAVA